MFVDTRLHLRVRPVLEYQLPAAGRAVLAHMLGDGSRQDALEALEACLPPTETTKEHEDATVGEGGEGRVVELRRLCSRVHTHTDDYLQTLATSWRDALHETHAVLRRATREGRARREEAMRVHRAYRHRDAALVDREYRAELTRIGETLEAAVAQARSLEPRSPVPHADLADASRALKEAFAASYGHVPTHDLVTLRHSFEAELVELQRRAARPFVRAATQLLLLSSDAHGACRRV